MKQEQSVARTSFSLPNFEGPLELLLYLIQKEEVDVCDIFLKEVTEQFFKKFEKESSVDEGADFLGLAATLLLMKSRKLLPSTEEAPLSEDEEMRFTLFHHLLEYCQFREVAEKLSEKEERERIFFPRGALPPSKQLGAGLEEVGLSDLASLLQQVMSRASYVPHVIKDEEWQVGPMIEWLQKALAGKKKMSFDEVFSEHKSRGELIVLFLALLELMKHQHACIRKTDDTLWIEGLA